MNINDLLNLFVTDQLKETNKLQIKKDALRPFLTIYKSTYKTIYENYV